MGIISVIHPNYYTDMLRFREYSVNDISYFIRNCNDILAIIQISVIFWDILKYFLIIGREKNNKWKVHLTQPITAGDSQDFVRDEHDEILRQVLVPQVPSALLLSAADHRVLLLQHHDQVVGTGHAGFLELVHVAK